MDVFISYLGHTASLPRERSLVGVAGIFGVGALSGNHHRALYVTEVVALDKGIRHLCTANAINRHAVIVVVVDMSSRMVQTWRT